MFYTYFHTRNDTRAVFYVGKGKGRRSHDCDRNQHWNNIVAKHGHTVHIAARWPTEAEAFEHEKFLIACFRDMRVDLCNMTDGGEGSSGAICTAETRAKRSASMLGKNIGAVRSAEFRERLSVVNSGKTLSVEHRAKISASLLGAKNPQFGKKPSAAHVAKVKAGNLGKVRTEAQRERYKAAWVVRKAAKDAPHV